MSDRKYAANVCSYTGLRRSRHYLVIARRLKRLKKTVKVSGITRQKILGVGVGVRLTVGVGIGVWVGVGLGVGVGVGVTVGVGVGDGEQFPPKNRHCAGI